MAEMTLAAVARGLTPRADQPGVFSGYASLFGAVDSQGDLVEKGAFRPSLEVWRAKGRRPAMLWQHDHAEPIGLWTGIEEDATGLKVEGRLLLSVRAGAEAYEHIKAGTVTGLSIGYQAIESRRDRKTGLRVLSKVTLWEISLVTFPANEDARIGQVKTDEEGRERLAQALRRVFCTRPVLPFRRKALTPFEESTGRPQPRDDHGLWARVAGPGVGSTPAAPDDPTREARTAVDWSFISKEEEGQKLRGYWPGGKSGVMIGTGVDLGQRNEADFDRLTFESPEMKDRVKAKVIPYFGRRGLDAQATAGTLRLTGAEAEALDRAVRREIYEKVSDDFDRAAGAAAFTKLPREAQTAIVSVAYNQGPNLKASAPRFWGHVIRREWHLAARELRNWSTKPDFPESIRERRQREALLLDAMLESLGDRDR